MHNIRWKIPHTTFYVADVSDSEVLCNNCVLELVINSETNYKKNCVIESKK